MSPAPRVTVATGVAIMPSGSLRATPMRTLPTSMPTRTPRRTGYLGRSPSDGRQRRGNGRNAHTATLRQVVTSAAAAAENAGRGLGQRAGADPESSARLVDSDDHGWFSADLGRQSDNRRVGTESSRARR